MANFAFEFVTFRYCVNKGWSSKRLNDNVQVANTDNPKMWGTMSQLMLLLKFPRCCYHSNRVSSDTNITFTVKLILHKRVVWCKNCGSILFTSRGIANFSVEICFFVTMTTRVGLQKRESQRNWLTRKKPIWLQKSGTYLKFERIYRKTLCADFQILVTMASTVGLTHFACTVKLATPKSLHLVQESWWYLIYKLSYSRLSVEIYQFLLPWQQGWV